MEIIIAAADPAAQLAQAMLEGLAEPEAPLDNARIRIEIQRPTGPAVVRCLVDETDASDPVADRLRKRLAEVLADFVIEHTERRLLLDLLARRYGHVEEDHALIVETARRLLVNSRCASNSSGEAVNGRKAHIFNRLQQHLDEADTINLDGMLNFRLGDYVQRLHAALDRAVEETLLDREQREFIALLRQFVARQDPRSELVHVLFGERGEVALLDQQGRQVTASDATIVEQLGLLDIDAGDIVISALVAIAPRRVLIHEPPNFDLSDLTETLRQVFPNRLYVCRNCRLCRSHGST